MPVVEPMDGSWEELCAVLADSWAQVTAAANWMVTELYSRDVRRRDQARMPPMPRVYLYPEARRLFPGLAPLTVASLEHTTQAIYRATRYQVIWTRERSLPTYRYPVPLPVHNQCWKATLLDERPVVRVRIAERWWNLRLRGGPRYHRQLAAYGQLLSGEGLAGELSLYRRRAHEGRLVARPNSNQRALYAIACKMVAWLPRASRETAGRSSSVLEVQTGHDALLVAGDSPDAMWRYHGDHLRRWSAEYRRTRRHFADDDKATPGTAPVFADRRTAVALKYQRRMLSAVREAAAHLIGYAKRRGCARLRYDDSVRAFCPDFPFAALREWLRQQCDGSGIAFEYANDRHALNREDQIASFG
jgi:hypothetical protein